MVRKWSKMCPGCHEPAVPHTFRRAGWSLTVDADRLRHSHRDGEPLCPEMTSTGYQPSLPVPTR
jgi:hypothetical protein